MGKDVNSIKKTFVFCFLVYCSLLGVFCTENIRKKWSSTEQASNTTVAKKILEVPYCKSRQIYNYMYPQEQHPRAKEDVCFKRTT